MPVRCRYEQLIRHNSPLLVVHYQCTFLERIISPCPLPSLAIFVFLKAFLTWPDYHFQKLNHLLHSRIKFDLLTRVKQLIRSLLWQCFAFMSMGNCVSFRTTNSFPFCDSSAGIVRHEMKDNENDEQLKTPFPFGSFRRHPKRAVSSKAASIPSRVLENNPSTEVGS